MINMDSAKNIIELQNITTIYEGERIPAIYDIDFTVKQGEFVSIIGPNGAGKTTLLETINGILPYISGVGYVFGKEIKKHKTEIRKNVGYVIQNFEIDPLAPFLSKDIVMTGRAGKIGLFCFPTNRDWKIVYSNMKLVGMKSFVLRPIGKLSGGEFQKILLARALSQEPKLFLLDEPFSNLDLSARKQMGKLITKIHDEQGITIVMVSHDIQSIPKRCSRVVVLDRGRIIKDGKREDSLTSDTMSKIFREGA
ncbi:MAG: metal ABC transporter ATP-binding protein [Candidatus Thermoplasmatota archaeon]|nr:metal ABC transporter ATP-binding protein [Candidatus Thermoplasmatota archaeon]